MTACRKLTSCLVAFMLAIGIARAATIYVPDDHPLIQDAIAAAGDGDTIIVRPGTYHENIDFLGKAIVLQSDQGAAATIIDGMQLDSVVAFISGEGMSSVLYGFTITNGADENGAGILCTGGSHPTIMDNVIENNEAVTFGGGIYCNSSSPSITGNRIADNGAGSGGGIACRISSSPAMIDNTISGNRAMGTYGHGGGIYCYSGSDPVVTNCSIHANKADGTSGRGGGIACWAASPSMTSCTVVDNNATDLGGGLFCKASSAPLMTNSILWDNSAIDGSQIALESQDTPSSLQISFSDAHGGQTAAYVATGCTLDWGTGMIDADPLFVEPVEGDFHLYYQSPCRDTGDDTAPGLAESDFEGDPRIHYNSVDMGVDEFHIHLYCTGSVVPGNTITIKVVGHMLSAPTFVALGSGFNDPPLSTAYGDLHIALPLLQRLSLGVIPSTGVLITPATIPTSWQQGDLLPIQGIVGLLSNPASRLTNHLAIRVE